MTRAGLAIGTVILLAACSSGPTRPAARSTTLPTAVSLVSVTIEGVPGSLAVATQVQLQAAAAYSDGSQKDVTPSATWRSSNTAVATGSATGQLVALAAGETEITATFEGTAGRTGAAVGGYRVRGVVHETAPTSGVAVPDARVEIVGGSLNGLVVTTDAHGAFELPFVASPGFRIKIKKAGYDDVDFGVVELPRDLQPDIALSPTPGPPPVARLRVHLDEIGSTVALRGFTRFAVDGTASSAHEPATYTLDFGDGTSTDGAAASHVCQRTGMLTLRLTATDRFGRSSTTTTRLLCMNLADMGGYGWDYRRLLTPPQWQNWRVFFHAQSGAEVSGVLSSWGDEGTTERRFTGVLSGQRTLTITLDDGTVLTGEVVLKDRYDGTSLFYDRQLVLRANGGPLSRAAEIFRFYDPF